MIEVIQQNDIAYIINSHFGMLLNSLKLTTKQQEDAKIKYDGVAKCLHKAYYGTEYNGEVKLLIGSFAKHTNIRPPSDIDLIFKIPKNTLDRFKVRAGNGPAELLQDIKNKLNETYPITEKHGWVKVVTVEFSEGRHRVEVLPAFENADKTFTIPNSSGDGSWEIYDARSEINNIKDKPTDIKNLIKIVKHWRNGLSAQITSYEIENKVLQFSDLYQLSSDWLTILLKFYEWLLENISETYRSVVKTAYDRLLKANAYRDTHQFEDAFNEVRKVFSLFPAYDKDILRIDELEKIYPSEKEEFIEDLANVRIDPDIKLRIRTGISPSPKLYKKWGRDKEYTLDEVIKKFGSIPPHFNIKFTPSSNYNGSAKYKWKVRNFGEEAQTYGELRGEIRDGDENGCIIESTKFKHDNHYVECYMVIKGFCVARARKIIPISGEKV